MEAGFKLNFCKNNIFKIILQNRRSILDCITQMVTNDELVEDSLRLKQVNNQSAQIKKSYYQQRTFVTKQPLTCHWPMSPATTWRWPDDHGCWKHKTAGVYSSSLLWLWWCVRACKRRQTWCHDIRKWRGVIREQTINNSVTVEWSAYVVDLKWETSWRDGFSILFSTGVWWLITVILCMCSCGLSKRTTDVYSLLSVCDEFVVTSLCKRLDNAEDIIKDNGSLTFKFI